MTQPYPAEAVERIEWRSIENGPEDRRTWQVSNHGDVRVDGRIVRQHRSDKGYMKVVLGKRTVFAHRLVAMAFINNSEGRPEVNHINGDKTDNRPENLEWSTRSQNMKHAYDTGLHPGVAVRGPDHPFFGRCGKRHPQSKAVRAVFQDGTYKDYESQGMAEADGFRSNKISDCINGRIKSHGGASWLPLPPPPDSEG